MVSKFGSSIVRSMFLIICSASLIADVESIIIIGDVVDLINDVTSLITGMDGLIDLIKNDDSDEIFQTKVTNKLDNIYNACLKIDEVKDQIRNLTSVVDANAISDISKTALRENMNDIYNQIKNYRNESIGTYNFSIIDNNVLKNNLTYILRATRLASRNLFYGGKNIFEIAVAYSKNERNYHRDCNDISAYDKLYNFYKYIVGTVTQGYTMIIMAYEYRKLKSSDPTFYKNRQHEYLNIFKRTVIQITESVQHYLDLNNNINFKSSISCDPQSWKEGENYIRIKNYASFRTSKTASYDFTQLNPDPKGIEYECASFAEYSDSVIPELISTTHCPNVFIMPASRTFSESSDFPTRIMRRQCSSLTFSFLENIILCYYGKSDPILSVRKLSLSLQTCKTEINEVVTNTRFHVQEGIISIEIQCGVFVNGKVDPNTLRWNTDDRRYTRENHPNYVVLSETVKSFNLDDIVLPDGEFVTGIKFEKLNDSHLSLVLQGTQMYDSKNRIVSGRTTLRFPENTTNSRVNIDINQLTTPLDINKQTYELSQSGTHYVDLTTSKWSDEYTAYSTIPFLDMQPVGLSPAVPLGGMGLFYKSQPGYGGFLAFKHISPKFMHFISKDYVDKLIIRRPVA
ncbi:uncharacterized protein LOC103570687 [Microplitis demolitor]|uniref:uncharacterized protein LOC103570687 n=1 Tax=Microplitis demolitor TaxID=69319 RepID=UPI00235B6696|nr:uncharacterized protein LOC103570687 [Microplitis demolitor]